MWQCVCVCCRERCDGWNTIPAFVFQRGRGFCLSCNPGKWILFAAPKMRLRAFFFLCAANSINGVAESTLPIVGDRNNTQQHNRRASKTKVFLFLPRENWSFFSCQSCEKMRGTKQKLFPFRLKFFLLSFFGIMDPKISPRHTTNTRKAQRMLAQRAQSRDWNSKRSFFSGNERRINERRANERRRLVLGSHTFDAMHKTRQEEEELLNEEWGFVCTLRRYANSELGTVVVIIKTAERGWNERSNSHYMIPDPKPIRHFYRAGLKDLHTVWLMCTQLFYCSFLFIGED